MLHSLIKISLVKIKNLLKKKNKFSFGEIDKKGFRLLFVDGKETKLQFYHFQKDDIINLQNIAKELYEQGQI